MTVPRPVVAVLGALDTKGAEVAWLRERLGAHGCEVVVVDTGVLGAADVPADRARADVAAAAGADLDALRATGDRDAATTAMGSGAAAVLADLLGEGRLHGVLGLGGSNAASVTARAVAGLPLGLPKLLVSTLAAGDTRPYVGETDLSLMYPVLDVNGLNRLSRRVLANAAASIAGMAAVVPEEPADDRPVVALSMFGVTTACGSRVEHRLDAAGRETWTFHSTGVGGRTQERLVRAGLVHAVADLTTTELADEVAGGVCSAGEERLTAAAACGVPQVVSLGALDMVNFGPAETVPERYRDRLLLPHNPQVTLMRTSAEECAEVGRRMAARLNASTAPTVVLVPEGGLSQVSVPGAPFHDPDADRALVDSLTEHLADHVDVRRFAGDVNDPALADTAADLILTWTEGAAHV